MNKNLKFLFSIRQIVGVYFLLIGLLIIFKLIFPDIVSTLLIICLSVLVLSIDITIRAIHSRRTRCRRNLVVGLSFAFASLFSLFVIIFKWNLDKLWPLYAVCPGLALIIYYCLMNRRSYSVLVPGVFLLIMSGLLLLFTTDIVTLNKKYLFFISLSILFIIGGILLILPHSESSQGDVSDEN